VARNNTLPEDRFTGTLPQSAVSAGNMAPAVQEEKNPSEYADCRDGENQDSVLQRRSSCSSRSRSVLVAHGATLRRGIRECGKETGD